MPCLARDIFGQIKLRTVPWGQMILKVFWEPLISNVTTHSKPTYVAIKKYCKIRPEKAYYYMYCTKVPNLPPHNFEVN